MALSLSEAEEVTGVLGCRRKCGTRKLGGIEGISSGNIVASMEAEIRSWKLSMRSKG